ncbi:hypothetical protein SETIT_3G115800v2 [Setaria italica]|uniref:Uncharacterized protein n=1 Tax=Setaria italica TaxID=4555 RepID=A0A368QE59_SETIT|nr:hypothetical protein SETIT_3G115800v2 [Setaria italica]
MGGSFIPIKKLWEEPPDPAERNRRMVREQKKKSGSLQLLLRPRMHKDKLPVKLIYTTIKIPLVGSEWRGGGTTLQAGAELGGEEAVCRSQNETARGQRLGLEQSARPEQVSEGACGLATGEQRAEHVRVTGQGEGPANGDRKKSRSVGHGRR